MVPPLVSVLQDYHDFAAWHVASGDVDPVYPVLGWLHSEVCNTPEEELAFTMLYVAFYSLPSALAVWLDGWREGDLLTPEQARMATGVERRAHRDVRQFARHMDALLDTSLRYGSLHDWLHPDVTDPAARWATVQARLTSLHGNGRWAAYKVGEILDTVHGWNCPPPDAGHAQSSGPRHGLADLFPETAAWTDNRPDTIARLDVLTARLYEATGMPGAQGGTTLCDWHNVRHGAYHVGHDIDLLHEHVIRTDRPDVSGLLMQARTTVFDHRWLGEHHGWTGVRRNLKRLYLDHGIIHWWDEGAMNAMRD